MYTSPGMQNLMLKIISLIRKSVYDSVKETKVSFLLVDETKDVSKAAHTHVIRSIASF